MQHEIVDVPGDGNCFFYSIYGALKDAGLLKRQGLASSKIVWDKRKAFAKCFRGVIADIISRAGQKGKTHLQTTPSESEKYLHSFFDLYHRYDASSIATALEDVGRECYDCVSNHEFEGFTSCWSKKVREDKTWVSQIDVSLAKTVLRRHGIRLLIVWRTNIPAFESVDEEDTIVLMNCNNMHYKYIKYVPISDNKKESRPRNSEAKNIIEEAEKIANNTLPVNRPTKTKQSVNHIPNIKQLTFEVTYPDSQTTMQVTYPDAKTTVRVTYPESSNQGKTAENKQSTNTTLAVKQVKFTVEYPDSQMAMQVTYPGAKTTVRVTYPESLD
jgi:hypothetical protein